MSPKFAVTMVERPEESIAGMKIATDMNHAADDCPKIWRDVFGPRMCEVQFDGEARSYGASFITDCPAGAFDYWAAMPICEGAPVPVGMEKTLLPAGLYAECPADSIKALMECYGYLFSEWLPSSKEYRADPDRPSYELYPEDHLETGRAILYFPITPIKDGMTSTEAALRLLAPGSAMYLITTGADGRPDARVMSSVHCNDVKTVWMLTGKQSAKYVELSRNPQCLLYATAPDDTPDYAELRLWGSVEILDDPATRAAMWRDMYACYFPDGKDDPNLCVLKFTADSGMVQTQMGKEILG